MPEVGKTCLNGQAACHRIDDLSGFKFKISISNQVSLSEHGMQAGRPSRDLNLNKSRLRRGKQARVGQRIAIAMW
jgi:hypothetical protein